MLRTLISIIGLSLCSTLAHAQSAWECDLLIDQLSEKRARLDERSSAEIRVAYAWDRMQPIGEAGRDFDDFEHFFDFVSQKDTPADRYQHDWAEEFDRLSLGQVMQAWENWQRGGAVECRGLSPADFMTVQEARSIWRRQLVEREFQAMLPPSSPGAGPVRRPMEQSNAVPDYLDLIRMSRPAFDEYGSWAIVIEPSNLSAVIYRRREGRWVISSSRPWVVY